MDKLSAFVAKFDDFTDWQPTKQLDYFTYHFLVQPDIESVTATMLTDAFKVLNLKVYKRTAPYLSENASKKNGKYIKADGTGYRLVLAKFNEIDKIVRDEPNTVAVDNKLTDLIAKVADSSENDFLKEAANCYRTEAYRAFIILVWIVTMDHLQRHIFANELTSFNTALAKNPQGKSNKIINYDDFSDLKETKFIELSRSANIISNDVRKILDEKLGTRNSAAHPSGIKISGHKATEFGLDLIDNVLLKY